MGKERSVRRSPQAAACRKRGVEELGRPQRLLHGPGNGVWYTAPEARKGKPGDGTMLEPTRCCGTRARKAEEYGQRENPLHASGESYHA